DPPRRRAQGHARSCGGRRRARGGPQVHLRRQRDPGRGRRLTPPPESGASRQVEITNKRGLHARASAKFVQLASELAAPIEVEKDGNRVVGTSIMALMMLGAAMGD